MSELNNEPPTEEEPINIEEPSSSGPMLITMLLLISGLILTGTMMLHYSAKRVAGADGTASPSFSLTNLLSKGEEFAKQLQNPEKEEAVAQVENPAESQDQKRSKLFGNREKKVNWPKLKLTGFGSSTEGGGDFAIINGKQVLQGQLIDGKAQLTEIRSHDVMVEYMGETKTLTVDIKN